MWGPIQFCGVQSNSVLLRWCAKSSCGRQSQTERARSLIVTPGEGGRKKNTHIFIGVFWEQYDAYCDVKQADMLLWGQNLYTLCQLECWKDVTSGIQIALLNIQTIFTRNAFSTKHYWWQLCLKIFHMCKSILRVMNMWPGEAIHDDHPDGFIKSMSIPFFVTVILSFSRSLCCNATRGTFHKAWYVLAPLSAYNLFVLMEWS